MSGRSKSDPERAALESAFARVRDGAAPTLPPILRERLEVVLEAAESGKNKAALAVVATLLVRKAARPEQNIRFHQAGMPGGFSGRGLDERLVTPFMKTNHFPAMISGSGWLTRSIGQPLPYDADYPGNIRPPAVKSAFLGAVDEIQSGRARAEDALAFLLAELIARRDASAGIKLNRPVNLTVAQIIARLTAHFARPNSARLPTQMIVNGVAPTLKYYLRLLKDASPFVNAYVAHLETDPAINYALKEAWNQLGGDNSPPPRL